MRVESISAIILAAGTSSRMGSVNKLLYEWRGRPLLSHIVSSALDSKLSKVVVVTGYESSLVSAIIPSSCILCHNSDYAMGMSGSIRSGIYGLHGLCPVMVLPGDMPLISVSDIDRLISRYVESASPDTIVVGSSGSDWGHPVLFGTSYFGSLKTLTGDEGARSLLLSNSAHIVLEDIGEASYRDFDNPESFI